jgi:hypothetical protein
MSNGGIGAVPRVGIGPMSKNAVDAAIALAYDSGERIMLIPSRRQVERAELGGGYVEGWSTAAFAQYVRSRDPERRLWLCRDHGGPWQHPAEKAEGYTEAEAMASSLASFRADIEAGFDLLHIDTCMGPDGTASIDQAMKRLVKLYGECHELARASGRAIRFEMGFEDQGTDTNDPVEFREQITEVCGLLAGDGLPVPTFVVAQTGTKVTETENCGALLTAPSAVGYAVERLAGACADVGSALKAHNMDYLDTASVRRLMARGVAAINVAPEFGVVETRAFLGLLDRLGLAAERAEFLRLAHDSGAWRKWLKPDTTTSDADRAVIAGHYVYGSADFLALKAKAVHAGRRRGVDVDAELRDAVYHAQRHYLLATAPLVMAGEGGSA